MIIDINNNYGLLDIMNIGQLGLGDNQYEIYNIPTQIPNEYKAKSVSCGVIIQ